MTIIVRRNFVSWRESEIQRLNSINGLLAIDYQSLEIQAVDGNRLPGEADAVGNSEIRRSSYTLSMLIRRA